MKYGRIMGNRNSTQLRENERGRAGAASRPGGAAAPPQLWNGTVCSFAGCPVTEREGEELVIKSCVRGA